jgi:hypothetical protein
LNNSKIPQWQVGFGTYPKTAEEGGSVQKGRNKNVKRISYFVVRKKCLPLSHEIRTTFHEIRFQETQMAAFFNSHGRMYG